ncbi:MAG: pyrroline-5-carboxylate reductase [Rubrivivax sp.]|nr:MAG: pyrroline-5-carboxylate reductase [Rubrivivax sp.]
MSSEVIAFIGGGNMASAVIGGLLRAGLSASQLRVVEPHAPQRDRLAADFGLQPLAAGDATLADAGTVVWAVKPQLFAEAAAPLKAWLGRALQLSVMAGIRTDALVAASGSERVVRAMPNTPALIGQGIAGLYARPAVSADERAAVDRLLAPTGQTLWVEREDDLDAVTALSGSGPAYFFFFVEAMMAAAVDMGLSAEQGRRLALATCAGAAALGLASDESPATLRERVTSKGGTTYAAVTSLQGDAVDAAIRRAVLAAQRRAAELGREFG